MKIFLRNSLLLTVMFSLLIMLSSYAVAGPAQELDKAVMGNNLAKAEALLKKGVSAKTTDHMGNPMFILAVYKKNLPMMRLLYKHGADINSRASFQSYFCMPALQVAIRIDCPIAIKQFLIDNGADVNLNGNFYTPLMDAVGGNDLPMVKILIAKGAKVNARIEDHETALVLATADGHKEMIDYLLANGADVNLPGGDNITPLMNAVKNNDVALTERLIALGAEINALDGNNNTAFYYCAYTSKRAPQGSAEIARILLDKGVNIDQRFEYEQTLLIEAAKNNCLDLVQLLLARGAQVNLKRDHGWTALMMAASYGRTEMVRLLLQNGADVNAVNDEGKTALQCTFRLDEQDKAAVSKVLKAAGGK
ncbi:MAG: ankyrin repeat domain-containing protein [Candidatus Margulisiibacteriota bacterium]|jgi:ankyrin repeat protein